MSTIVVALLLTLQRSATSPCLGVPSHPSGFAWTYSGTRIEGGRGGRGKLARVTWTTTVVDARTAGHAKLVLIRGFVTELAWSEPSTAPKLSILVCSAGSLFRFEGTSDQATRAAFVQWDDSMLSRSRLFLQTPLYKGQTFGQDSPRQDPLYSWDVETLSMPSRTPLSCGAVQGDAWRLTYRTNPDLSLLDWQDGVGVVGYTYEHHGTPSKVDVRLVSCSLIRQ
jgi:hypothetical protein